MAIKPSLARTQCATERAILIWISVNFHTNSCQEKKTAEKAVFKIKLKLVDVETLFKSVNTSACIN